MTARQHRDRDEGGDAVPNAGRSALHTGVARAAPDRASILVIDDDEGTCETLKAVLEVHHHTVRTATCGRAGVAELAAHPVDVAIVDINLPDVSGLELLSAIKDTSPVTEVIFFTGGASLTTAIEAFNGEAFAYITKPFEMDHLLAIVRKALEKQRLARALGASEAHYRNLVEGSIQGMLIHDAGVIRFANRSLATMLGVPGVDALIGRDVRDFMDPAERPRLGVGAAALDDSGGAARYEFQWIRADGSIIWTDSLVSPATWGDRRCSLMTVIDITERKRAEDRMRRSEERYRILFESNPYPMWLFDDATLRFVAVNAAAIEQYGYTREEFLAMRVDDVCAADDGTGVCVLDVGRTGRRERRHRKKDGTVLTVEVQSELVHLGGRRAGLAIVRDVTELKRAADDKERLEAQLRQSQKMEAIGRLAGGIAHDFNNLLTIIVGRSELLLEAFPSTDLRLRDVELIQKSAERATMLTRRLLAFSRKQVVEPRVLDLNAVIGGIDALIRRLIGEDIELTIRGGAPGWRIEADPGELEQVILNLVINARDAMPEGGPLTIQTAAAVVPAGGDPASPGVPPGDYVMLSVRDTGTGMDGDVLARLFEPFFTTKEPGKGTGLGLVTVHGIIERSGGHITVDSAAGRGSTFTIYLPRVGAPADGGEESAVTAASPQRGAETVLVVEDEDDLRDLAVELLEASGYTVLPAAFPEEALVVSRQHRGPVHVLLTDVVLPGMNGGELATRLRLDRPEIKILFMSGYIANPEVYAQIARGSAFLPKPFKGQALVRKVREVLDTARAADTAPAS